MRNFVKVLSLFVFLGAVLVGCKTGGNYNPEVVNVKLSTTFNTNASRYINPDIGKYENSDLKYQVVIQNSEKETQLDETYDSYADLCAFEAEIPAGIYDFTVNALSDETVVLTGTVNQEVTPENYEVQIVLNIAEQKEVLGTLSYEVEWVKPLDKYYEIKFTITNLNDKTAKVIEETIDAVAQNQAEDKDAAYANYTLEKDLPEGSYSLKIEVIQYPNGVTGGLEKITTKYEPYFNVYPVMTTSGDYTFNKLNLAYTITYDCEVEYRVDSELFNNYQKEIILEPVSKPYHNFSGWFVVEEETVTSPVVEETNDDNVVADSITESGVATKGEVVEETTIVIEKLTKLTETDDGNYVFYPAEYLHDVTIRAVFEQQVATPDLTVNFPEIANAKVLDAYWDEIIIDKETGAESVEPNWIASDLVFNEKTVEAEKEIYFTSDDDAFNAEDYVWAWYKDGLLCSDTENTNKFTINTATDKGAVDLVVTASKDGKIIYTGAISYFSYR